MQTKRKIIHLIGSGTLGGREKELYLILRAQTAQMNDEVTVLFQRAEGPNYELIAGLPGLRVLRLPNTNDFSLKSMIACFANVRKADVVFLYSPRMAFMLPLLFTPKPLIYRLCGMKMQAPGFLRRIQQKPRFAGGDFAKPAAFKAAGQSKRKDQRNRFMAAMDRLARWLLFRWMMQRRANLVLANSHFLQNEAGRKYRVPANKFRLVRNGLDLALEQQRLDAANGRWQSRSAFTVCFVGRLESRKRVDRLLRAIAPLVKVQPALRLLVAGDGELKKDLVSLSCALRIETAVQFLGAIANPYEVLKAADLFVLPSDNEAFANAVLEAMFAAVPVAVFAGGCGNSEVIAHWRNGFVVANEIALTRLIGELLFNRRLGEMVGQNGKRVLFEQELTLEKESETLNNIINEFCRAPIPRRTAPGCERAGNLAFQDSK